MGLVVTINQRTNLGAKAAVIADVAFDSSYVTGGEEITAASLGLVGLDHVNIANPCTSGYLLGFVPNAGVGAGGKIKACVVSTGAEVAAATDLSALTGIRIMAIGY